MHTTIHYTLICESNYPPLSDTNKWLFIVFCDVKVRHIYTKLVHITI